MKSKNLSNFPFWIICVAFLFGVFISKHIEINLSLAILIGCTGVLSLIFLFKKFTSSLFVIIASLIFICLGIVRFQVSQPNFQNNHIIHFIKENQPQQLLLSIDKVFKHSKRYHNYKAEIHSLNNKNVIGNILLSVKRNVTSTPFSKGDYFVTFDKPKLLKRTNIPYAFEYTDYLNNQHITYRLRSENSRLFSIPSLDNWVVQASNNFRKDLETNLQKQKLLPDVRQLTEALVLGNKSGIDKQLNEDYANAGVIHILAISGLHIGIIYLILMGVFKRTLSYYSHRIIRSILILICLWLFAWFSGGSPSAIRATTMFSCFEIARLLMRRQHPINPLFATIFILLAVNPIILFSVGFQLSVVAVASIIIGVPKLLAWWYPENWLLRKI